MGKVQFKLSQMFQETFDKFTSNEQVAKAFKEFKNFKEASPSQRFGSKDYKFVGELEDYWHTGLTFNVNLVYQVQRQKDDYTFLLYGVFTHDELGTGQPSNLKKQKSVHKRLKNQDFV